MQGKIKNVFPDREFGFIIPDDGSADLYFHRSNLQPDTFARLARGQRVTFDVKTGIRGKPEGFNLTIESPQTSEQPMKSVPSATASATSSEELLENQQTAPSIELVEGSPDFRQEKLKDTEPEEAQESDATIRRSKWGKVKRFDGEKGFGFITPDEGGGDIFVHLTGIQGSGFKMLFPGEAVLFEIGEAQGRRQALYVRPAPVPVLNGKILSYDEDDERGMIQPNEGGDVVVFHATGVVDKDLADYDKGEVVKFRKVESDAGPIAVRVTRLDRRKPLESFADLSNLDRLLPKLAEKAAPEEWNFRLRPLEFPYPILENYLFYTFKRVKQEEKIVIGKDHHGD